MGPNSEQLSILFRKCRILMIYNDTQYKMYESLCTEEGDWRSSACVLCQKIDDNNEEEYGCKFQYWRYFNVYDRRDLDPVDKYVTQGRNVAKQRHGRKVCYF